MKKNTQKSWLCFLRKAGFLHNKLHAALHDPYIYTLNEVENTDVFDEIDGENQSEIDNLFDDNENETMVEIVVLKNSNLDGEKLVKDTILEVSEENANKLIKDGKAKLTEET